MNICKDNVYLENVLKLIVDWVKDNNITANTCYKCFGTAFSRSDFKDYFIDCIKYPTVTTVQKILLGIGYEFQFHNLNGCLEYDGNLRQLVRSIISPYRIQYIIDNNILSRSTCQYLLRSKNDCNELYISLDDFTYLLYKLNIQLIIKKI